MALTNYGFEPVDWTEFKTGAWKKDVSGNFTFDKSAKPVSKSIDVDEVEAEMQRQRQLQLRRDRAIMKKKAKLMEDDIQTVIFD